MVCKHCGKEMIKDDVDFNFKGNYDTTYICEHCKMFCVKKVRFGKVWKVEYHLNSD